MNKMSHLLAIGSIATFIGAWLSPTYELFVLSICFSALLAFVAVHSYRNND